MDPINRLNRLMEILRQQISNSPRRTETTVQTRTTRDQLAATSRSALPELRQRIQERLQAIGDGPAQQRQAKRIFLESVLAWEFGENLLLDKHYSQMLDGIQTAFEADPELDKQFTALLTELSRK